jgi:Fic family protein
MTYIWQRPEWPAFRWDEAAIQPKLSRVRQDIGYVLALADAAGLDVRQKTEVSILSETIESSGQIEGERLGFDAIRSSVARRLGVDIGGLAPADRHVDGVVELTLDATRNAAAPLTDERLFGWQSALFPSGRSGIGRITTGAYRTDADGPMRVISGPMGREKVHYEAPPASRVPREMHAFLDWFNAWPLDGLLMSAIAHLWLVTIHPFEDGNGRLSRAVAEMALARSDGSPLRLYSVTAEIRKERAAYYSILAETQTGDLDITAWLLWYLDCLGRALEASKVTFRDVRERSAFWARANALGLNARQRQMLATLLDGFEGKLTTSKWAALCKCSQDTAARDIAFLVDAGVLERGSAGGRSTAYALKNGSITDADR